jgi:hypothetical protein
MPATVSHALSATTPDDPNYEIQIKHWNSAHAITLNISATEISPLFSNSNGIEFGTTDGKITASYTVPTQSVQTQASGNIAGVGFTSTTTAGTEVKATLNTAGLSMAVPAYLTAAEGAPGGAGTGFTTTTVGGEVVAGTLNSDGLKLAVPAYLTTAALSGDTTKYAGVGETVTTTAGTDLKLTVNTAGVNIAHPVWLTTAQAPGNYLTTARASNDAVGLNTALTANGVAWTVNSSGISLNVPAFLTTAAASNHSHGNPQLNLTNLSGTTASNSAGFTLSLAAAAPGGGAAATVSVVEIMDGARLTTCAQWNNATYSNRPIFIPFEIDNNLASCGTIRFMASRSSGTVLVATMFAGIYSRNNATSANLISSTSLNISHSTSALHSGVRVYDITGLSDLSLSPGRYLFGLLGSAAATNSLPLHLMGGDPMLNAGFVLSGTNQSAATASNSHILPFWGVYSATSGALPAAVAQTQVSGGASQNSPDVYAILKAV